MAERSWLPRALDSFAARILILLVVIGVVPLAGLGLIHDYYTQEMLDKLSDNRVQRRLDDVVQRLNEFLANRFGELELLADLAPLKAQLMPNLPAGERNHALAVLENQADQAHLNGIVLVSNDGTILSTFASRAGKQSIDWDQNGERLPFRNLYQDRDRGILGPVQLEGGLGWTLFLFQRVYRDQERNWPIGVVALYVSIDSLVEIMGTAEDEALVPYPHAPSDKYYPEIPQRAVTPAKVVASSPLLEGWELVIMVDEHRLTEPIVRLRKTLLFLIVGTLAGIIALIALFYVQSARRIRKLTAGAEAIAHGNLEWRLEDHGRDELSALSSAFNRMAEQLQSLIDSAVQSEKMASLGKLATTIAHEVRNPLASIKTGVQVVREDLRDADQSRILGNVIAEIDRLNRVATELLTFAKPVPTRSENATVEQLIERVHSLVEREAAKRRVRISTEIGPDLTIRVDLNQMQQVLMNLVLNSLHAMPEGGELRLHGRREDHRVLIGVTDSGAGMSADMVERVARPFVTSRPDGTGIGLSISRQLVERNQGRMTIDSEPGRGTTVTLSFPALSLEGASVA